MNDIDLTKQVIDEWTVLDLIPKDSLELEKRRKDTKYYRCKCSCGKISILSSSQLLNKKRLNKMCRECAIKKKSTGVNSPLYSGHKGLTGKKWKEINRYAKKRNLELSISIEDAWNLFQKQDGKCNLTGVPIFFGNNSKLHKIETTASLDRINSNKGYVIDNLQWVHKKIQKAKIDFEQNDFINICSSVAKHCSSLTVRDIESDILNVTEQTAIGVSKLIGRSSRYAIDEEATSIMKENLNRISFSAHVAIGEGKKDRLPGLFYGDLVGSIKKIPNFDLAIDPVDGTKAVAENKQEAISVIAVGSFGSLFATEQHYMFKLAVGSEVASRIKLDISEGTEEIIKKISLATAKDIEKITACVLDRPRHEKLISELRTVGCRIKLIQDCDVFAAISTAIADSGIDVYLGVGGAPEGVIAATALKCMRGDFQGILCDKEGKIGEKTYQMEDLAAGDVMFCATGITNGSLLKGVKWTSNGPITHSLLMRSESGTLRWLITQHGN